MTKEKLLDLFKQGIDVDDENENIIITPTQFRDLDIASAYVINLIENCRLCHLFNGCDIFIDNINNKITFENLKTFKKVYGLKNDDFKNFQELLNKLDLKEVNIIALNSILDFAIYRSGKNKLSLKEKFNDLLGCNLSKNFTNNKWDIVNYSMFKGILGNNLSLINEDMVLNAIKNSNVRKWEVPSNRRAFEQVVNYSKYNILDGQSLVKLRLLYEYDIELDCIRVCMDIDNIINNLGIYQIDLYDTIKNYIYTEEYVKLFKYYYYDKRDLDTLVYMIQNINHKNVNVIDVIKTLDISEGYNKQLDIKLIKELIKIISETKL